MTNKQFEIVRSRMLHSVSPQTAERGGMTFEELLLFRSGNWIPSDVQLRSLARYLGVEDRIR